jgi:hypothetical protein
VKGLVFRLLERMVTERMGLAAWDALVEQAPLRSRGGFVGSELYPDEDLTALVATAARVTGRPADELVRAFGRYAFLPLATIYPTPPRGTTTAKEFLQSVDRVLHVEVCKLHRGVVVPRFDYEDPAPDRLVMLYRSARQLCDFAAGLIDAVADYFGEDIHQEHPVCTKRGHDHCRFELRFAPRPA